MVPIGCNRAGARASCRSSKCNSEGGSSLVHGRTRSSPSCLAPARWSASLSCSTVGSSIGPKASNKDIGIGACSCTIGRIGSRCSITWSPIGSCGPVCLATSKSKAESISAIWGKDGIEGVPSPVALRSWCHSLLLRSLNSNWMANIAAIWWPVSVHCRYAGLPGGGSWSKVVHSKVIANGSGFHVHSRANGSALGIASGNRAGRESASLIGPAMIKYRKT